MNTLPPITVSTTDRDRLFAVLDNFKGESDQIDYLYDELARAHIVEADAMTDDVVTLGSRLRFRNEATGKEHERVLTLPHEAQSVSDAISILTPAGAALLGLKVGDNIQWPLQGHFLRLRLLTVSRR
ncbi:MAG: regulator of nucleoside diphosphate kinase [Alcanivorax sp.]|jgi:regulator of nucleoside diphosphate kinase|uniref:nucleoside diphosphate kinase regulator n=1 Tax=unclassified Alcanivorax TaxID=2638842 RepID=UPI0026143E3F|nr:nucleoside diphosphate kinase regulator [uncultured Alcanivorax sp.]